MQNEGLETRENGDAQQGGQALRSTGLGPLQRPRGKSPSCSSLPPSLTNMTCEFQIVSLQVKCRVLTPTCDHEELLQVLDDVNLEDCSDSWDVGQGVLQDIQRIQPFLVPTSTTCQGASPREEHEQGHVPITTP